MPKSNSQQKSTPDARTRHQQVLCLGYGWGPNALRAIRGS